MVKILKKQHGNDSPNVMRCPLEGYDESEALLHLQNCISLIKKNSSVSNNSNTSIYW